MTQHCSQNTARATRHKRESRARPRITRQTHDALQPTRPVLPRYKRESRARSGLTRQTHDALQPKHGPCYDLLAEHCSRTTARANQQQFCRWDFPMRTKRNYTSLNIFCIRSGPELDQMTRPAFTVPYALHRLRNVVNVGGRENTFNTRHRIGAVPMHY